MRVQMNVQLALHHRFVALVSQDIIFNHHNAHNVLQDVLPAHQALIVVHVDPIIIYHLISAFLVQLYVVLALHHQFVVTVLTDTIYQEMLVLPAKLHVQNVLIPVYNALNVFPIMVSWEQPVNFAQNLVQTVKTQLLIVLHALIALINRLHHVIVHLLINI
jgi:hypothetical protein